MQEIKDTEVIQAAKFIHWVQNDPAHKQTQLSVGISHFRSRMAAYAQQYGLDGKPDTFCVVVADIRHQGRAKSPAIVAALQDSDPLNALLRLGEPKYHERLLVLRREINKLVAEGTFGHRTYSLPDRDLVAHRTLTRRGQTARGPMMNERIRRWILQDGPMLNTARMIDIYHLLSQVLVFDVPGAIVELGCHKGQSAVPIREILDHYVSAREFHVYDSFLGLPPHHEKDAGAVFPPGALQASRNDLLSSFTETGLLPPIVHEGWFEDTLPHELPERISFAHIDGDLYTSILYALEPTYPRLFRAAIVIVDDYDWEGLPRSKPCRG